MKRLNDDKMNLALVGCVISLFTLNTVTIQAQDGRPVAEAGSSRYAGPDPIVLDGTGSYDPDSSGPLSYMWQQISGPSVVIIDANTATPTIAGSIRPDSGRGADPTPKPQGFPQTDEIQECEFELVVSDGELTSLPDIVKVVVVPAFVESGDSKWTDAKNEMVLESDSFDPNKPTIVFFDGATGGPPYIKGGTSWAVEKWKEMANVISFVPYVLDPDSIPPNGPAFGASSMTCSRPADMIIVFLSAVAPDYKEAIQTLGQSMGGVPAIDVALRLNKVYKDARYAVNRVSFLDATAGWLGRGEYNARVRNFLRNSVDGEQCWLDSYKSSSGDFYLNALNVSFLADATVTFEHGLARDWYRASLVNENAIDFNHGIVAGAYWSVVGPGKNLQLSSLSTPGIEIYDFTWYGNAFSGYIDFFDESSYPGRLPEPVTLIKPVYTQDSNGFVLTCEESENAVGYELLFGNDPYRVMDYEVISDTPAPPNDVITILPFEKTWWTIRVRDQYGSTIYADPIPLYYFASKPDPSDGALITVSRARLSWTVGIATASYNVYFGDNINDVSAGAEDTLLASVGRSAVGVVVDNLIAETTYYWRVDSVKADSTIHMGDVWRFTLTPQVAYDPIPADGSVFVSPRVSLSWERGLGAVSHTVHIGENFDEVNNATGGTAQLKTTFTPGTLELDKTYYWRVDEYDGSNTHKGDVWSFETPPFIEITDPNLVAWWKLDGEYFNLGYVVDYSGYNHHGTFRGDVHPVEGYDGGAMEFDGSGDYINIDGYKGINADANGVQPAFSVSAWFKTTDNGEIVSWGSYFSGKRFSFRLNEGRLRTEHGNGNLQGDTICNDGEWHNFTLTVPYDAPCDDPDTIIYLDGVIDSRVSTGTSNTYNSVARADVSIGRSATSYDRYFLGLIDDVRIYDIALTAEEIAALAQ